MNKKLLTIFMMALLSVMGVKAYTIPSNYYSEPGLGTYYIYNVTTNKFLGTANMSEKDNNLLEDPFAVTITSASGIECKGGGDYILSAKANECLKIGQYQGQWLWSGAATDQANYLAWTFTSNGTKTYKMSVTLTESFTENGRTISPGTYYMQSATNIGNEEGAGTYAFISTADYNACMNATYNIGSAYYTTPEADGVYYLYNTTEKKFLGFSGGNGFQYNNAPATRFTLTYVSEKSGYLIGRASRYIKLDGSSQFIWSDGNTSNSAWWNWTESPTDSKVYKIHSNNFGMTTAALYIDGNTETPYTWYLTGTNASNSEPSNGAWAFITADKYLEYMNSAVGKRIELNTAITTANELAALATYNGTTKNSYSTAISTAQSVYDDGTKTAEQYEEATSNLESAMTTFLAAYPADVINNNAGDVTAAVLNANFEANSTYARNVAWTGVTGWVKNNQHWTGNQQTYGERTSAGTISQTLKNVPAGTYKVVAALRAENNCTIQMKVNNESATLYTGAGNSSTGEQINTNGVQMPYSSLGGFLSNSRRGFQWRSVEITLASATDLTISFYMNGGSWRAVDDVHLYKMSDCVSLNGVSTNQTVESCKTLTCDIVLTNPNVIISSSSALNNIAGARLNNNIVDGTVSNLVLYDGNEFSASDDFTATAATLYRSITADAFATICTPFAIAGGADGTFYQPSELSKDGVLTFETEASPAAGKAYLYKASSAVTALTGSGTVKASPVDNGEGVVMKGRFTTLSTIPTDDYVLSGTSLYKVNSTVSCNPFRAYFNIPSDSEVKSNVLTLSFDDLSTGIEVVNGEVVDGENSVSSGAVYNLSGQRVNNPKRGLYIINGKKVVIK